MEGPADAISRRHAYSTSRPRSSPSHYAPNARAVQDVLFPCQSSYNILKAVEGYHAPTTSSLPTIRASASASPLTSSSTSSPHYPSSTPESPCTSVPGSSSISCPHRWSHRIAIVLAALDYSSTSLTHLPPRIILPGVHRGLDLIGLSMHPPLLACGRLSARGQTHRVDSELRASPTRSGSGLLACTLALLDLQHPSLPRSRAPDSCRGSLLTSLVDYDGCDDTRRRSHSTTTAAAYTRASPAPVEEGEWIWRSARGWRRGIEVQNEMKTEVETEMEGHVNEDEGEGAARAVGDGDRGGLHRLALAHRVDVDAGAHTSSPRLPRPRPRPRTRRRRALLALASASRHRATACAPGRGRLQRTSTRVAVRTQGTRAPFLAACALPFLVQVRMCVLARPWSAGFAPLLLGRGERTRSLAAALLQHASIMRANDESLLPPAGTCP
ncbi:hypothetical protein B0H13DRAFT_2401387 [Mycena leptocephala]|nr:hypothetical protein B0H13DRAFT_2401387 [Mycena leptocephala]